LDRKRLQTLTLAKEQRRRRLTRVSPPGLPPAVAVRGRLQRRRFVGACTVTEWKRSRAAARHAGLRTAARPLDGGALARGRKRAPASGPAAAPPPPFPHGRPSALARCEAREEGEGKENRKEKEGKKETLGVAGRSWRQTEQCAPAMVAWWPGQPLADTARRASKRAREEAPSQRHCRP